MTENPKRFRRKLTAAALGVALLGSTVLGGATGALVMRQTSDPQPSATASGFERTAFTPAATSLADMVQRVMPAVVQVQARQPAQAMPSGLEGPMGELFRRFGQLQPRQPGGGGQAMGSGFIVDAKGIVVTNAHVVDDFDELMVKLADGRELPADLIGKDEKTDLAVLRIKADKLAAVSWGDSEQLRVGEDVVAVGSPFGLGSTVTKGIVSGRDRSIGAGPYDEFLQIDAPINQGNSGGPLFDASGRVVGVNTAIFSPSGGNVGIGFAIPSDMAKEVVAQLTANGTVSRGQIGVSIQNVTPEIADSLGLKESKGALVAEVVPGSPAARAGLRPGDIVRSFGEAKLEEARDLSRAVARTAPGDTVRMVVQRGEKSLTLPVRVGGPDAKPRAALAGGEASATNTPRLGLQVVTASPELNAQAGQPRQARGVMIVEVEPSSGAAQRGLRQATSLSRPIPRP